MPELNIETVGQTTVMLFSGRLDAPGVALLWDTAAKTVKKPGQGTIRIDLESVDYMDMAGATFISYLSRLSAITPAKQSDLVTGVKKEFVPLLDLADQSKNEASPPPPKVSYIEKTGRDLTASIEDAKVFITMVGEITAALLSCIKNPGRIRWADTWMVAERSGVNALPIVALISFIVGLVMAFQAAIPMRMFGAEIYVANLIGIAMIRELGPLMTAIVLAGRSASAFAAEIGTMKINEEIDALTVMGMEPVRFLIIPRVIAATLITPLLTVFSNFVGILGGMVVILSFGYPPIAYYNQVVGFVSWEDLAGGLVKCFVFGLLIAATGCIRGYQTLRGPSAVGDATTRAVVSSIILIAVFDGIFSIIYFYLGI
ncbi:MlaE family lipid ABC transporter permease subunit [uncultured Desulfobacter sp.]|uniref:ABC transporter permease n=1 Tax=uncultured Desulfobacter sp. TaxID=240139 RepID=UPI0029F57B01|nr:MlaE family lipid ABC transporter permease subunit [uncultured Desulfobacter sp.]